MDAAADEVTTPEATPVADRRGAEIGLRSTCSSTSCRAEDDDEVAEREPSPYDRPGRWYVVHTYAGYENKVKSNLESRISSMNMEDRIFEVVIPMEDVVEFKAGKQVVVQRKVFPGYLLCRCDLDDDSWSVIRQTPGVTGFVGPGTKPTPLPRRRSRHPPGPRRRRRGPEAPLQAAPRARDRRDGPGQGRSVRRLLRPGRRDQRGPAEAEGAGQHLRPGDPGRARVQPGRQALSCLTEREERSHHHGTQTRRRHRQDPAPCGRGHARPAGRHRARAARRPDDGVRASSTTPPPRASAARSSRSRSRSTRTARSPSC